MMPFILVSSTAMQVQWLPRDDHGDDL
jgi:hypothetical protein